LAIEAIRRDVQRGATLLQAARRLLGREPDLCLRVIEAIGHWPSSDVELRALQIVWASC
jgi:hypothetical protein